MDIGIVSEAIVGTAALFAALTGIWKFLGIGKLRKGVDNFLDDWNGRPPRDGDPGKPSFPSRLSSLEKEFKPNGGGSLRDLANQAAADSQAARQRAEEAADATAEISGALGRAAHSATTDRAATDVKIDALADSFGRFARDTRLREKRYIEALADKYQLDLTGVTEDLNDGELGDEQ